MYGQTILANYRRAAPADAKYAEAPTFREFVEFLVELPIDKFDPHWKPMYLQCLPCHLHYRVVGRLDTLARDSAYVLAALGLPARLPHSHGTRGKPRRVPSQQPSETSRTGAKRSFFTLRASPPAHCSLRR